MSRTKYLCSDSRCIKVRFLEPMCEKCLIEESNPHYRENHKTIELKDSLIDLLKNLNKPENKIQFQQKNAFFGLFSSSSSTPQSGVSEMEQKTLDLLSKKIDRQIETLRKLKLQFDNFSQMYLKKRNCQTVKDFVCPIIT